MVVKGVKDSGKHTAVPSSDEFTKTLGQVTWLLTMSKEHQSNPISSIEADIIAPLMMRQVRVYTKGKQPLAVVVWAYASDEIVARLDSGETKMELGDWRSGGNIKIVHCISPLLDPELFAKKFLAEIETLQKPNN